MLSAERVMLETDAMGQLMRVPKLPANSRVEVIFLMLDDATATATASAATAPQRPRRQPHPSVTGKVNVLGDIVSTVDSGHWNLPS